MTPPAVSVLIPTYNRAALLPGTLTSVFDQTLPPDEVILVDDGSTDDTAQVVRTLLEENPNWAPRLRYMYQPNRGKSEALNTAMAHVRHEWIAFNDSDDTWRPDKLERQFQALRRFPECQASFTETTTNEFATAHPELTAAARDSFGTLDDPSRLFPSHWPGIYMQTIVVRADTMARCGPFDPEYRVSQDVDFMFRLGLLTPFCYCDLPLVFINRDPARPHGLIETYPPAGRAALLEEVSRLDKWTTMLRGSHPHLQAIIRASMKTTRSGLANACILAGDVQAARQVLSDGLRECPSLPLLAKYLAAWSFPVLLKQWAVNRSPLRVQSS